MNPYPITSEPVAVGKGYSVEFKFDGKRLNCQWSPTMPYGQRGRALLPAYKAARNAFFLKIAAYTGKNIAVIDLPVGGV